MPTCDLYQHDDGKWYCRHEGCALKPGNLGLPTPAITNCPVQLPQRTGLRSGSSDLRVPTSDFNPPLSAFRSPLSKKGPGDCLHELIERFAGETPDESCQCRSRIRQMNAWGVAGCRKRGNEDQIVEWLVEEATRRNWRIARWKTGRWGIRRLVRFAVRQAERAAAKSTKRKEGIV